MSDAQAYVDGHENGGYDGVRVDCGNTARRLSRRSMNASRIELHGSGGRRCDCSTAK